MVQQAPSFRGQPEPNFTLVPGRTDAPNVSGCSEAVYETDGAVVTDQELLGECADRGLDGIACPVNREQGLVLLGSEPSSSGCRLAENQELPDMVPEVSE